MTTFHSQLIIGSNITIIPCFAMNLKLEDLSQYIVIIIFILIIFKVLGSGFIASIYEFFTGKKQVSEDEFDIDSMISRKKSQLSLSPSTEVINSGEPSLKNRVLALDTKDKDEILTLLNSLEWGDISFKHASTSKSKLADTSNTQGLPQLAKHFFRKTLKDQDEELLKIWSAIYDNSVLWTNLVNAAKEIPEKKALLLLKYPSLDEVQTFSLDKINHELHSLLQPSTVANIEFMDKEFSIVSTEEIFEIYQEKVNLFKSLRPIVPKSKENSKKWALEILGLNEEASSDLIKNTYKKITTKIHPDKFSSLNLSEEQTSILNSNLSLVNKAYAHLKK